MQTSIQDKDQWSANADSYAKGTQNLSNFPVEMLFKQMNYFYPFSTARSILDVGSGPGATISKVIATYGSQLPCDTRLIASDFSAGMIKQVRRIQNQKQDANPIWNRVEAMVLDAHVLDGIQDTSISHITGTMVYNLVANGRQALETAYRVLQPAGIIGITLGAGAEWIDLMGIAAKKIRGESAPTYQFPKEYGTLEGIRGEFDAVGFSAEFVEITDLSMDLSDPKPFVDHLIRGKNPGAIFFVGDYSETELTAFSNEVLSLIEERHPELPRKLNGRSIVAVGKKLR